MFLTKTKNLLAAQRDASQRVARATKYSLDLPIVGRVLVPPPEQLAIYAALGGLAVLELIDWPVAVAMGVGSALVARRLSDLAAREDELADAIEPVMAVAPVPDAAPAAKPPARTTAAKAAKTPARKAPATKTPAKKAPAKKAPAKKAPAKKAPGQ